MRNMLLTAIVAGSASAAIAGGPTIVLDNFAADPNDQAGGPRTVSAMIFDNPFGQAADFTVDTGFSFNGINGAAIFNSGVGVKQEGTILWDNNGAGLGLDAAALGVIGFELDFLLVDLDFSFLVELSSADGSASLTGIIGAGGARTESLMLGDFDAFGSFDPTAVDSVRIIFNLSDDATGSLDFILTEFRAVIPAPGAVALLGMGGLLASRRRR